MKDQLYAREYFEHKYILTKTMYGFFKCDDCGLKWESAKVYFKTGQRNVVCLLIKNVGFVLYIVNEIR